ncbi:MAG TPA: hypothetical protein P5518_00830 [Candidatus Cloacimonas sp.]|jgi:uncharacterized membrane protein YheB (UPF0754 family)|nr:hypothetical protein [Candidatus Cloacimonas sp.]MDD2249500.1 hypothetical protein [Candidatus Cloacimonadota bacterium]HNU97614.1 hypothetical protein [Candidatus Syntrophosphaera thermopropionivorans]MCK9157865.1 hypothetical protein [Candidatus Cloacimonas sp.]MCK9164376.1 hypothetical protein [Candidatus Cloacimonas sp.]
MIFLKSLTFIVWNVILGCILLFMLKWLLFNRKARYIFGIRIPLTPGFLVAKRDWLFDKVRDLVQDYLDQAANPYYKDGYLSKWIKQIRHFIWDKTDFVDGWFFIPVKFKLVIRDKIADAFTAVVEKFLRKTVPRIVEHLQIEHQIDEFDIQLSVDFFYSYFKKYVYKPLLIGFAALNLVIGIMNMIWFLIIV